MPSSQADAVISASGLARLISGKDPKYKGEFDSATISMVNLIFMHAKATRAGISRDVFVRLCSDAHFHGRKSQQHKAQIGAAVLRASLVSADGGGFAYQKVHQDQVSSPPPAEMSPDHKRQKQNMLHHQQSSGS